MYSLKQAAEAVGKSKATIHRDVKTGKISAHRDEKGHYKIDPSELHRVYPPVTQEASMKCINETIRDDKNILENDIVQTLLKEKDKQIELKEELLEQIKSERDKIYGLITNQSKQAEQEINKLRKKVEELEKSREHIARTARRWKKEAKKPWYKKLFKSTG